mgnify:FL=1
MKLIKRDTYLKQLIDTIGTPDIKVITGVRRSGKSKLMESFIEYVKEKDSSANIIHLNLNLPENENLLEYHSLYNYINSLYKEKVTNYVFVDEIQMCKGFEKAIIGLHTSEKYDIYITGSNAFLLSSDLATLFTGRTFRIEVYPFSFKEYCKYFEIRDNYEKALEGYIKIGGMSGSYLYKSEKDKQNYLKDVYTTLVLRDIVQKYAIKKRILIEKISDYMMDNISNITTARNITKSISGTELSASNATVTSYIKYLCNSFAFYQVRKYDVKGKKYLTSHEKYYLCDHALRYSFLGTRNIDYGRVIENIVAIELLRRGFTIYAGALYGKEIDFVAMKHNQKIYIQVSDNISNKETLERELTPLKSIKDAYPKQIIARTYQPDYDINGIKIIDLTSWLMTM